MNVVMELRDGSYVWYVIGGAAAAGDDDDDDNDEGAPQQQQYGDYEVCFADYYRHMSREDWQAHQGAWMRQMDTWRATTNQRFDWMYDHTVRHMQHLSTRDRIEPHLQIDPFPGR